MKFVYLLYLSRVYHSVASFISSCTNSHMWYNYSDFFCCQKKPPLVGNILYLVRFSFTDCLNNYYLADWYHHNVIWCPLALHFTNLLPCFLCPSVLVSSEFHISISIQLGISVVFFYILSAGGVVNNNPPII